MKIIIGLGNPDSQYKRTRHNLGFMVLDKLAEENQAKMKRVQKFKSLVGGMNVSGIEAVLAKPITYMNRSGDAVARLVEWYKIPLPELMVICDDINLKVGTMRIRRKGCYGGHRGLESIIDSLGNDLFPRMRLGISPLNAERFDSPISSYVLDSFTKDEKEIVSGVIDRACTACIVWMKEGMDTAMNRFNRGKGETIN